MAVVLPRICPVCNATFTPKRSRVVCCSKRCAALRLWDGDPSRVPEKQKRVEDCRHCGRVTQIAARGLCYPCHRNPSIRVQFDKGRTGVPSSLPFKLCPHCRHRFQQKSFGQMFCTRACRDESMKAPLFCLYSAEEKDQLFREFSWVGLRAARSLWRSGWVSSVGEFDDLLQIASLAILHLIDRHDRTSDLQEFLIRLAKSTIRNFARKYRKPWKPDLDLLYRELLGRSVG